MSSTHSLDGSKITKSNLENLAYMENKENLIFSLLFNEQLVVPDSSLIFFDSMRQIFRENPAILEEKIIFPLMRVTAKNFRDVELIGAQNKVGDRPTDSEKINKMNSEDLQYNQMYGSWIDKKIPSENFLRGKDMEDTFIDEVTSIASDLKLDTLVSKLLKKAKETSGNVGFTSMTKQWELLDDNTNKDQIQEILQLAYTITPLATINVRDFHQDSALRLNLAQKQFNNLVEKHGKKIPQNYTQILNEDAKIEYDLGPLVFDKYFFQKNFDLKLVIELRKTSKARTFFDVINNRDASNEDKLGKLYDYISYIHQIAKHKEKYPNDKINKLRKMRFELCSYPLFATMRILIDREPISFTNELGNLGFKLIRHFIMHTHQDQQIKDYENKIKNEKINHILRVSPDIFNRFE